jgi:hypothetical protein
MQEKIGAETRAASGREEPNLAAEQRRQNENWSAWAEEPTKENNEQDTNASQQSIFLLNSNKNHIKHQLPLSFNY